jgi:colanic acid/amylovoran biosynthesis glycosyltransferase
MIDKKIAIVSTNRKKYSETFIHSHLKYLSNNVLYLFDGYLPKAFSLDKLKTEHFIEEKGFFWGRTKDLKGSIIHLLQKQKISLVLVEYGPSGVEMMDICNEAGIPLVVHFHGYDAYRNDVLSSYGTKYSQMFQKANMVVAVSKNMVEQLVRLGCPLEKLTLIPYGIDVATFALETNEPKQRQLVSCGRFVAKKAPQLTIQAFNLVLAKHPELDLVMIGEGELLDECKHLAVDLGIRDKIIFKGALPPIEIAQIFSESIIFLQHSVLHSNNDSEGLPLAILEAGASGLPVVSTIHAGIPDAVENGKDGFLVPERDIEQMAEKILFLLDHPEEAFAMGQHFKTKILSHYTLDRYMEDLKELIKKFQK